LVDTVSGICRSCSVTFSIAIVVAATSGSTSPPGPSSFSEGALQSYLASASYDVNAKPIRTDFGNNVATCHSYDNRQRLTGIKTGVATPSFCTDASPAFQHLGYGFTRDGLIACITDQSVAQPGIPRLDASYTYDRLYELTSATIDTGRIDYAYDEIQNLVRRSTTISYLDLPLGDFGYGHGYDVDRAGPNAIASAGSERFAYDAVGRMERYGDWALEWNVQGQLVAARHLYDGRVLNYRYDFAGERLLKWLETPGKPAQVYRYIFGAYEERASDPTWLIKAGSATIAEVQSTAGLVPDLALLDELVAYAQAPSTTPRPAAVELLDFDADGTSFDSQDLAAAFRRYWGEQPNAPRVRVTSYYHPDHLGSGTLTTDPTAAVISHTGFYPYGAVKSRRGAQPRLGFTGAEADRESDLGLIRMGARWYSPRVGRWATPDPLYQTSPKRGVEKPFEFSLYGYVSNNPLNSRDPNGLDPVDPPDYYQDMYIEDPTVLANNQSARQAAGTIGMGVVTMGVGGALVLEAGALYSAGSVTGTLFTAFNGGLALSGGTVATVTAVAGETETAGLMLGMSNAAGLAGGMLGLSLRCDAVGLQRGVLVGNLAELGLGALALKLRPPELPPPPRINAQKQAGHVPNTPQLANRLRGGKRTSTFFSAEQADQVTIQAWEKGKHLSKDGKLRLFDFGKPVGVGPEGGGYQTQVRVSMDSAGTIHGTPYGPAFEGPLPQ